MTHPERFPSKLPGVGTTIFTVMSQLAAAHEAINLSQGYPDFDPPARLLELVIQRLQGGANQYAPMAGLPALRVALAAKLRRLYGREVSADEEITITAGGTEALFCALQCCVGNGDEVLLLDPAYDSYAPAVTLAGGQAIRIPLQRPGFGVDWARVRAALGPRTRAICINSPHNPSGAVLQRTDLDALAAAVRDTRCVVVADEVYEHMVFDGLAHASVLTHAELAERSFVVSSFGKTCHATGWKVGYCVAPRAMSAEFRKLHQYVQFAVATPFQAALADFLDEQPGHADTLPQFYQRKRDLFCAQLARTPLRCVPSPGTYFQLADYSAVSELPDLEFARWLTTTIGVAAIPISVFSAVPVAERLVRFCFAKNDATLVAAGDRLAHLQARSV